MTFYGQLFFVHNVTEDSDGLRNIIGIYDVALASNFPLDLNDLKVAMRTYSEHEVKPTDKARITLSQGDELFVDASVGLSVDIPAYTSNIITMNIPKLTIKKEGQVIATLFFNDKEVSKAFLDVRYPVE